jgi:hypothetical protein
MWFILSGFLTCGMLGYLMWAKSRGLLDWSGVWSVWLPFATGGTIIAVLGGVQRWRWLRKRAALHAYEQMIASLMSHAK